MTDTTQRPLTWIETLIGLIVATVILVTISYVTRTAFVTEAWFSSGNVENLLGTIVTAIWGLAAIWMVFWTGGRCPLRYPLLFGTVSMLLYLALNEFPRWVPSSVTADLVSLTLIGVAGLVAIAFLLLIIDNYNLVSPRSQGRSLCSWLRGGIKWLREWL